MAAPTQVGVEFKLGFNGLAYVGYQVEDWSESTDADEEIIKDSDGGTMTIITYDPKEMTSGNFLIKSTGSIEAPAKNSLLSIQGPNDSAAVKRRVASASVAFTRGAAKLSVSLIREDSMASTYDA